MVLTHTISFYYTYIKNKYDKSKLETEEQVDDYFTCIYTIINKRTLQYVRQFHQRTTSGAFKF